MKKLYILLLLATFANLDAQNIIFTDANFKARLLIADPFNNIAKNLLGNAAYVDANHDNEIQVSEALQISQLDINTSSISALQEISYFTNLAILKCNGNNLTNLDLNGITGLFQLNCANNQISTLNLGLSNINSIICNNNQISSLDLSNCVTISTLNCSFNQLTSLHMYNTYDVNLNCSNNQLVYLFVKEGIVNNWLNFANNPNLQYVCADDAEIDAVTTMVLNYGYQNCHVNTYCTFAPGGTFYTVQGNVRFDGNVNGCDISDVIYPFMKFGIASGANNGYFYSGATGSYSYPLIAGTYTITPLMQHPAYFTISPSTLNVNFPTQESPLQQDFCISPNGNHSDLEINIIPLDVARPGFTSRYEINYKNNGNQLQSGTVSMEYNDSNLNFISANTPVTGQSINHLNWDFSNLLPFEFRKIVVVMQINSPTDIPAVNDGDTLLYNANLINTTIDETPADNVAVLHQEVINSFDPNDKTCLEGITITPEMVGEYVHYMIRFENTGTANAENIVVKDMIDVAKFDVSTLIPLNGSHSFITRITETNKVEFIFENINLPFDDANNDGYIAFKIKTKPTLVLGNTFSNTASIYFDYNFPIVTDPAVTTVAILKTKDFEFSDYFAVYPNPANDILNVQSKQQSQINSISIYNTLGQLLIVIPNAKKLSTVDVSDLTTGTYLIKINSDKGTSNTRFIKK